MTVFEYKVSDFSGLVSSSAKACVMVFPGAIRIPEVFTPNGDGINEVLLIKDIELYRSNKISIYDRDRNLVFAEYPYMNTWNGLDVQGNVLAPGTYYVVLDLDINSDDDKNSVRIYHYTPLKA